MGETIKIVLESFPVDELPEAVRRSFEAGQQVRVTVESAGPKNTSKRTFADFVGAGQGLCPSPGDATDFIRKLRDEWDD
jgi:hypothetical protein